MEQEQQELSLGLEDAARYLNVAYWRIRQAHIAGHVPEPRRITNRRIYDRPMLDLLRQYFDAVEAKKKKQPQE